MIFPFQTEVWNNEPEFWHCDIWSFRTQTHIVIHAALILGSLIIVIFNPRNLLDVHIVQFSLSVQEGWDVADVARRTSGCYHRHTWQLKTWLVSPRCYWHRDWAGGWSFPSNHPARQRTQSFMMYWKLIIIKGTKWGEQSFFFASLCF